MIARSSHILLLAFLGVLTTAQTVSATVSAKLKQKAAEEYADRIMRRFYETLDFGVIYREMFVSEPLKSREVRSIFRGIAMHQRLERAPAPTFDLAAMERAYIAKRNFDFLTSARHFTYDGDEEAFKKEAERMILQYYMPMQSPNFPTLTSEELDSHFTANLNHLSEFWRKFVVKGNFGSDSYRQRISLFQESRTPERDFVKQIGLGKKIYVVRRERLYLYFVEEHGKLKMLTVTPRVQD
jgi:hypothetical protein